MENASKALIIAGAILLSILIIAIGIFIFNGANSTITDSMTSMSTQEIEAFNNQFLSYDGSQSGSNVKKLIERLIANSNTYQTESNKIPGVIGLNNAEGAGNFNVSRYAPEQVYFNDNPDRYVEDLSSMRGRIENKHTYKIEFTFNEKTGLIYIVYIKY